MVLKKLFKKKDTIIEKENKETDIDHSKFFSVLDEETELNEETETTTETPKTTVSVNSINSSENTELSNEDKTGKEVEKGNNNDYEENCEDTTQKEEFNEEKIIDEEIEPVNKSIDLIENTDIEKTKHKNVNHEFPIISLREYQKLTHLDEFITRNKNMVSNDEIIKRLNLFDIDSHNLSKLDELKKSFILSRVYSSDIQNVTQEFVDNMDVLIENTKLSLAERYDQVLSADYEGEAIDTQESILEELEKEAESEIEEFIEKTNKEFNEELKLFETEQRSKLEAFKQKQLQEKMEYENKQNRLKKAGIEEYKFSRRNKYKLKREEVLEKEVYEREKLGISTLSKDKKELLNNFEQEIKIASVAVKENLEKELNKIREEVENKEHEWKIEIANEETLQEQQRLREIEERKLQIKEEELRVQREKQQLEANKNIEKLEKEKEMLEEKVRKSEITNDEMNKLLLSHFLQEKKTEKMPLLKEETSSTEHNQISSKSKTKYKVGGMFASLIGITFLGLALLKGCESTSYIAPNTAENNQSVVSKVQEETSNTDDTVKEEDKEVSNTRSNIKNDVENFNKWLKEGEFEKAINLAKDNKKLDKELINNEMRKQKALVELVEYNKEFDTNYGRLDELVLKDDIWGLFKEITNLEEQLMLSMSKERRNDIVQFMYKHNFKTYGTLVLESRGDNE